MIRKDGFKLMAFPVNKRIELYDLKLDPFEKNNLSEKLKFKNKINDMLSDLILIQEEFGDTLNLKQIFNVN